MSSSGQVASFAAPDTVCVNQPIAITNTSSGASTYNWNFCTANINTMPTGFNLGNPGNQLTTPCFIDYTYYNGNYYGFITSNNPASLVRYDFGNSLLNTPTAVNLGNFGNIIPLGAQGIQVINEGGKWYAIITGGDVLASPLATSRIIKIDFGTDLTNTSPIATNWGNIGGLAYPVDLFMFKDASTWYGFTVNYQNATITKFNFGSNFNIPPTGVNLGNLGGLNQPNGLCPVNDNGTWRLFVSNFGNNTISRIDFANSLLNPPSSSQNLGNVGGAFHKPRDLYIFNYCEQIIGFLVNEETNDVVRLNFDNLVSNPTVSSLGNVAGLNTPHSISKLFRSGSDLFAFVPNSYDNSISRIRFSGCSNSNSPNSNLQNPPSLNYSEAGIYNITLTIDEGLLTQTSFCKKVVVLATPEITPLQDATICPGNTTVLSASVSGATSYSWSPATNLSNPNIPNPVASPSVTTQYILTATNALGCFAKDTVVVNVLTPLQCGQVTVTPSFSIPDTVCVNTPVSITNTSVNASSFFWNFCVADGNNPPVAQNLANPGGFLSQPVFVDLVEDNGNFYGFAVNHFPGGIVRLDFGNNLLNNPTPVFLGNPSGAMNAGFGNEGIQIVKANGSWYGVIVGGNPASGSTPRLVIVKFGTSLNNSSPTAVNWGNIGDMLEPIDLHVFQENGNWYGFTVNAENNTITRFNFTNNFENQPTGENLGNVGGLAYPDGIFATNDNGFWRVFVTNGENGNSSLSRLDFGNSLLNAPTGVNLGNPGGLFDAPRDITVLNVCGQSIGFVVNSSNQIIKLNFGSLSATPAATNLGNLGNLNFPHSLSEIFRVGNDLYSLITNVSNNTITRLRFAGCSDADIPSSSLQNPSPVTYSTPGTYNITLMVDDGLPTQATTCRKLVVVPALTHSPTVNQSVCNGGSTRIGSAVSSAQYFWSTGAVADSITVTSPGIYWVESSRFGCSVRDSFVITQAPGNLLDFSYQQDMCQPKTITFSSDIPPAQNFQWSFGDGQFNTVSETPQVTYASYGSYEIMLRTVQSNGCRDSVLKTILVDNIPDPVLISNLDTVICLGDSVLLRTQGIYSDFCWKASSGNAPDKLHTYVKPTASATYTLTSQVTGTNLVVNGDFTSGNTGFTSDYSYAFPNLTEAQFWIGSNPSSWNGALNNCGDHSSGSGNMMTINGSPAQGAKIWSQTVNVLPNTNYVFATWLQSLGNINPASLQFSINGINLGNSIVAGQTACEWKEFSSRWNSGNNTAAVITIINNNTQVSGNDFALDDIFFGTVSTRTDSFTVSLSGLCDTIDLDGPEKVCSPTDTLTYSVFREAGCVQDYIVQANPAQVEIIEQSPSSIKVVFKQNGTAKLKVFFANDCKTVADSLEINVKFSPAGIQLGPDVTNCRDTIINLDAGTGFENYLWQNGALSQGMTVQSPGLYHVIAQNLCGQVFRDSFALVKPVPVAFSATPAGVSVCAGDSVSFSASGGQVYSWQPAIFFSQPSEPVSRALVSVSQDYTVFISDPSCQRDTTIVIPVIASQAAAINLSKSNDVDCNNDSAVLVASGGVVYNWTPNLYISRNSFGQITVKPPQNTTYYVSGVDQSGCAGTDSVTVVFKKEGEQKLYIPSAFTPNGDGLNDIFKPVFTGPAIKYDFRIFNRWGQLVFQSNNPSVGWNGYHAGKLQPADVFVYYITAEGDCNGKFEKKGTIVLIK